MLFRWSSVYMCWGLVRHSMMYLQNRFQEMWRLYISAIQICRAEI